MAINDYATSLVTVHELQSAPMQRRSQISAASRRNVQVEGPTPERWQARWEFENKTDYLGFLGDFEAVGYHASFDWTAPGAGSAAKYRFESLITDVSGNNKLAADAIVVRWHGI
jgi:hypothetical protein